VGYSRFELRTWMSGEYRFNKSPLNWMSLAIFW